MLLCGPLLANSYFPEEISMTFVWINSSFKWDTSVLIFLGKKFALTCLLFLAPHTPPPWTCFHSPLGAWSWFSPIFLAFCGPLTHCQITTFNLLSLRGWKLSPVTPFPSPQIFPSWLILGSLLDLPYTTEMSIIQAIIGSFLNQVSNWWWSYLEVSTR